MNPINLTRATLEDIAAWMLALVDDSDDHLAIVEVPRASEDTIDVMEAMFRAGYEIAKARRPDLAVNIVPPNEDYPDAAVLVAVHEHRWVGGHCANGCPDTRQVA